MRPQAVTLLYNAEKVLFMQTVQLKFVVVFVVVFT